MNHSGLRGCRTTCAFALAIVYVIHKRQCQSRELVVTTGKTAGLVLGLASALALTGCVSERTTVDPSMRGSAMTAATDCLDPDQFCVGLVLEAGVVDDGAFNEAAWQGVQEAAAAAGGVAEYLESTDAMSYASNLAELAEQGFDVVVASAVGQPQATIDAANAHPDTRFIGISQDMTAGPENTTGLIFRDDEAGYAAGYLAGSMTRSGVVGAVLGSESVLPLRRLGEGYRLGVLAARPDATVIMSYNNDSADSFNDPEWATTTASQQIADGADVIFGVGGTTGIAALETAAQTPGAGTSVFCIGVDVDQYQTVPQARPCLLTSAEKLIATGVAEIVAMIDSGTMLDRNFEGQIGLAPYYELESQVPDALRQQMDRIVGGLVDGSIATGVTF